MFVTVVPCILNRRKSGISTCCSMSNDGVHTTKYWRRRNISNLHHDEICPLPIAQTINSPQVTLVMPSTIAGTDVKHPSLARLQHSAMGTMETFEDVDVSGNENQAW